MVINFSFLSFFDWEYDSESYAKKNGVKVTHALVKSMTQAFMSQIEKSGYRTGFYYNDDYQQRGLILLSDYDKKYARWFARYKASDTMHKTADFWQYSENGSVPGVSGTGTDVNKIIDYRYVKFNGRIPKCPARGYYKYGDGYLTCTSKDSQTEIMEIQRFLFVRGYYDSDIDGKYGSNTDHAVSNFQRDEGIKIINGCWGRYCEAAMKKYV